MAGQWRGQGMQVGGKDGGKGKKSGKGGGKGKQPAVNPQMLDMQFQERAGHLWEGLMNWNAKPADLEWAWKELMTLRNRCMQAYGGGAAVAAVGGGGGGGGAPPGPDGGPNWKSEFYQTFTKVHKRSMTKDEINFEFAEVEGPKPGAPYYQAVMNIAGMDSYQGEAAQSKKLAEHNAAKEALAAEFPDVYQRVLAGLPAAAPQQQGKGASSCIQGQKRKAAAMASPPEHEPKQRLCQATQLLANHAGNATTMQKGDIVYETIEENGHFVSTVTLQSYDPSVGYQGLPADNKKHAESAAAEAALAALAEQIAVAEQEHQAKKAMKKQAQLAEFKGKREAKDAAKKASQHEMGA